MSDNSLRQFLAGLLCNKHRVSGFKIRKQVTDGDDPRAHILRLFWGAGSGQGGWWLHFLVHRPWQLSSSRMAFVSLSPYAPASWFFLELHNCTVLSKPVSLKDTAALRLGKDFSKK